MKVLLAAVILVALITPTMAEDDLGNMIKWEKASRNLVPKTTKPVPAAKALVRRANALLKGDPTCAAMLKASKLLDKAQYIYIDAKEYGGDVRSTSRRVSWLEEIAKAGKCRKEVSQGSRFGSSPFCFYCDLATAQGQLFSLSV